ncbi:cell division protein FtsK [Saccharobesus litoralis]|uniref:DNA translocase FtsK n=1 Tax=Saccharobesus litoralis TaxID=2172099 RepID=A0A2S0VV93_9ALTE|nr:DNA translocase FtsK 4TM domain-containing protein [Saccharobesus litoralis]AWB68129.1 cell division protein FtsK [Saccharobesus litoralis]
MTGVQRLLEVGLIATAGFAVFLQIALFSFAPEDPSWSQSTYHVNIKNAGGAAGAWMADLLFAFLGVVAYVVPLAVAYLGWAIFRRHQSFFETDFLALGLRIIGLLLIIIAATSTASLNVNDIYYFSSGGLMGDAISQTLLPYLNFVGTSLLLLCFFCTGITLLFGLSWLELVDNTGNVTINSALWLWHKSAELYAKLTTKPDSELPEPTSENETFSHFEDGAQDKAIEQTPESQIDPQQPPFAIDEEPNFSKLEATEESDASEPTEPHKSLERWKKVAEQAPNVDDIVESTPLVLNEQQVDIEELVAEQDRVEPSLSTVDVEIEDEQTFAENMQPQLPLSGEQAVDEGDDAILSKKVPAKEKEHIKVVANTDPFSLSAVLPDVPAKPEGRVPSFALLDRPDKKQNPITQEEMDQVARLVEAKLLEYKIKADVVGVYPGPVITRLELDLAPGIKVSTITNLSKDIARSLSTTAVRVVEVIPGKPYIGLELPNKHRETVRLSEVIEGEEFAKSKSPLTMVLGPDIAGKPVIADLAKMPHVLVAGTTGSGKSVLVNTMILSFLYKATPEEVRMIMIDPKMLELSVYEDIPHLLCEVVTDMKDASNALRWCVGEMERRYKLMAAVGVRNLKGFNAKVVENIEAGTPLHDPLWQPGDSMDETAPQLEKLPSIVVVIDEFADMMMIVGKKVEELIARIAQKARAAGIHLVLATQRPSVDVITGLIKANIPTRIGLTVSSKIDSRTILDQQGAESLLGMGDMLYMPSGSNVLTRAHGAFVDDHEVHAVVADWKLRGKPNYIDDVLNGEEEILLPGEVPEADGDNEYDALFDEAVAFVTETRKVSISSVQRKFRIGYNRAANIVEQMEMSGIVSSAGHNGAREVLAPAAPKD